MKAFLLPSVILLALNCMASTAFSQTLYYDRATNPGWSNESSGWSSTGSAPYTAEWIGGSLASFRSGSALTVGIGSDLSVGGLSNEGSTITFNRNPNEGGVWNTITLSGGQIQGNFTFGARVALSGDFEVTGGSVTLGGSVVSAYAGTATVTAGSLVVSQNIRLSSSSNFILDNGAIDFSGTAAANAGNLEINGGMVRIGRAADMLMTTTSVTRLSGTGGTLAVRNGNSGQAVAFTIHQDTDSSFGGDIAGETVNSGLYSRFILTKSGAGNLSLKGSVDLARTTTVSGGGLYVSAGEGKQADFRDVSGSVAIEVRNGARFGGNGSIGVAADNRVVVVDGGILDVGDVNQIGKLTFALGAAASLDLSGVATATQWLHFDLGSNATAGGTFDQIVLTGGTLAIGEGLLNFDDFSFTLQDGFAPGEYALLVTDGITGSLGSSLTGELGGYDVQIFQSGDRIVLAVVPEPGAVTAFSLGALLLVFGTARRGLRRR